MIKIDNQSMVNRFYKGLAPVGEIARSYHDGMEASVGEHFDNAMINCMGMASEDMWNRAISPISRCSDDFMPENSEWFHKHILQCSYNSFVQGQFYYCDWDMWWSDDGQAEKNSILRGISGGPIYVSDPIGRSKKRFWTLLFCQMAGFCGATVRPCPRRTV
ncbi:MAG: Sip1-related alpha-galactosidase [Clostridia bacterium]